MKFLFLIIAISSLSASCRSQSVDEIKRDMIARLDLPQGVYPVETLDEWFPNGDGYYLARYSLSPEEFNEVLDKIKKKYQYLQLPFGDEIVDDIVFEYVDDGDQGFYELIYNRNDPRDIKLTLLNQSKKELIVLISFQ